MVKTWSRRIVGAGIAVVALTLLAGCASQGTPGPAQSATTTPTPSATPSTATSITYDNTQYGFTFKLPLSWSAYTIVKTSWQGWSAKSGKVVATGPLFSIRHPLWSSANKRQDIPILIYTLAQWNSLGKQVFNMGAAPIPPSELGRNTQFVFALDLF